MMIFVYQIVTKPLTSKLIPDEPCAVCSAKGAIELTLYMRYIAMGIPLFGMGRRTSAVCTNCAHVLKHPDASIFAKKKYSATVASAIKDVRNNHKRTLWQLLYPWSIWFVMPVVILIFLGINSINQKNKIEKAKEYEQLLMHAQPEDIYKTAWLYNSMSSGVLVKLMRISGDTMFIVKTKKSIPFSYSKTEWDKLDAASGSFETKEYRVKKFSALKSTNYGDFFMYNKDESGRDYLIYLGEVLNNKCEMDLDFETIYRKK